MGKVAQESRENVGNSFLIQLLNNAGHFLVYYLMLFAAVPRTVNSAHMMVSQSSPGTNGMTLPDSDICPLPTPTLAHPLSMFKFEQKKLINDVNILTSNSVTPIDDQFIQRLFSAISPTKEKALAVQESIIQLIQKIRRSVPGAKEYFDIVLRSEGFKIKIEPQEKLSANILKTTSHIFPGSYDKQENCMNIALEINDNLAYLFENSREKLIRHEFWHAFNTIINKILPGDSEHIFSFPYNTLADYKKFIAAIKKDFKNVEEFEKNLSLYANGKSLSAIKNTFFHAFQHALLDYPYHISSIIGSREAFAKYNLINIGDKILREEGHFQKLVKIQDLPNGEVRFFLETQDHSRSFIEDFKQVNSQIKEYYGFKDQSIYELTETDADFQSVFSKKVREFAFPNLEKYHAYRIQRAFGQQLAPSPSYYASHQTS